jgi:hypothetical protein
MTAHADGDIDFKTQHVLEQNQNINFGLVFWPKEIRMDSFLVQKPNYGAAFAYCPVRWGSDFVPNSIILVFEYGTVFPWRGGDALRSGSPTEVDPGKISSGSRPRAKCVRFGSYRLYTSREQATFQYFVSSV